MAEKQIMGVWYRPMYRPVRIKFKNERKELQRLVGGFIETITIPPEDEYQRPLVIIVNEEGKLQNLPPCRYFIDYKTGKTLDLLVGNILVLAAGKTGEFESLAEEDYSRIYHCLGADVYENQKSETD